MVMIPNVCTYHQNICTLIYGNTYMIPVHMVYWNIQWYINGLLVYGMMVSTPAKEKETKNNNYIKISKNRNNTKNIYKNALHRNESYTKNCRLNPQSC